MERKNYSYLTVYFLNFKEYQKLQQDKNLMSNILNSKYSWISMDEDVQKYNSQIIVQLDKEDTNTIKMIDDTLGGDQND